jgi:Domain of unknown function (DUF222)
MSTATAPVFASAGEAMAMVHAGLAYIVAADAATMSAAERARCLRELEEADAVATAARTSVLGVFAVGQDYADDGDYSPCSWLMHRTRVTKGTAVGHTGWLKRGAGHPAVMAALAARQVSKSYAREICWWTDKLPAESRAAADEILLGAAAADLGLADLAGLAAEMYERSRPDKPDGEGPDGDDGEGSGAGFDDRSVTVATTLDGAGVIHGNLTPECAEFVKTVLDALSAPSGADDDRSHDQRYHDALQEAMRRLMAGGLVPQRGGQPLRVWAYISLSDLMRLPGSDRLVAEWAAQLHARWAGQRAAAAEEGGHQGLWLDGDAASGIACGAPVTPVITGDLDPAALGDLIRLCAELDRLLDDPGGRPFEDGLTGEDEDLDVEDGLADEDQDGDGAGDRGGADGALADAPADPARSRQALVQAIIGKAVELLSGPGGLASFLRRQQLDDQLDHRLAGPSLPLDIGYSDTVPASIRNAVRLRDKHCQWAGGCSQPAGACQVHHTTHKANGGQTSLKDCVLLCDYHHQVMIHRRGWTLIVNPDGTTTAWNKDKTKVLHSHGPPGRAGPSRAG